MTEAEILRRRVLRRAAIKKQQRRRTLFLTACGLAAVLLIAGIVLLCRGCGRTEGSPHNESIYGSFAMSDRSCVYTFREDGSGELRLSGAYLILLALLLFYLLLYQHLLNYHKQKN